MQLWQLLDEVPNVRLSGDASTGIQGLAYDSRQVERGYLFAAIRGQKSDGNEFVGQAIDRGAAAVLSALPAAGRARGVPWAQVEDERLALALVSRNYYGRPDEQMTMVGVTGTNGKTTVCFLLESIFREAGLKPCLLGTVLYRYEREETKAGRTTPESLDLHRLLDRFATAGARSCAMEVSSHALAQKRAAGIAFQAAVFTNLTQDHLDFHRTMEEYLEAKAILFRGLASDAVAVLNADDPRADRIRSATRARVVTFGETDRADVRIASARATTAGTEVTLSVAPGFEAAGAPAPLALRSPLLGRPNASNLAAAAAVGLALGVPRRAIARGLESVGGVPGRFERIDLGQPFDVLVDYAHTDDALRNLLRAVRELGPRRILTVFGCGGDRDRGKRPLMGFAAAEGSDLVVVTSDNPRGEDPQAIIEEILPGVRQAQAGDERGALDPARCVVIPDRKEAIRRALSLAATGECVVIAGKGHETYQILRDRTVPFDDREVARDLLKRRPAKERGRAVQKEWPGSA
ncbi:MAG: UDP-N-acetylmuramoyl-L-alanyl-D-glutamate--2,6-diaminopimelate ligase [Acidobacteria bacterium]|nr:UDP-N-acetylmuramoyl-L-alanyl-D-glutamate--2,6-diaminopimelate ligase [Acidobacteriota bacterium]